MPINISTQNTEWLLFIDEKGLVKLTNTPKTKSEKPENSSYHHGDLRAALIDASVDLVAEVGADAFTLKDASRIAGVSVAAPYRHFSDKSELLYEVSEMAFKKMASDMRITASGMELGTIESITALGKTYVRFANDNQQLFRLMCEGYQGGPEVNLEAILSQDNSKDKGRNIIDLLDVKNHDLMSYQLAKTAPNNGIACFSILLKSVAMFLDRNNLDVGETLVIATSLWAVVHGTAFLLIDHKFQNLIPGVDTDDIISRTTRYFLQGLLQEKKAS